MSVAETHTPIMAYEKIKQQGYAVVPLLDADTIHKIAEKYQSMQHDKKAVTHVTMFNPDVAYRQQVDGFLKGLLHEKMRQLMPGYRILYANFMVKESSPEGFFPVHQDWTYVDEKKYKSYAFWIPLQNTDEYNGTLFMVPGSVQLSNGLRGPYVFEPFKALSEKIIEKYAVPVPLQAGQALVWDHRIVHFSKPNLSPDPRIVFTMIMVPENVPVWHCYAGNTTPNSGTDYIEVYEVDTDFYMRYTIGQKPEGVPLIATREQERIALNEEQLQQQTAPLFDNEQSAQTAQYYDQWQHGYDAVYGNVIQAFRPQDTESLLHYIAQSAGINRNDEVLDAGCGVAGPAIWLAIHYNTRIQGITISAVQAEQASRRVQQQQLQNQVQIQLGDYHLLDKYYDESTFDKVLFLESLGHAGQPEKVIEQAYRVLKPGGAIYIKDFYYKEPGDVNMQQRIHRTIDNINRLYSYNTLNLTHTIASLRKAGFEIDFIRKFGFTDDISIRYAFEEKFGIDIFGGEPAFTPAEWLEIKCIKPF